MPSKKKMNFEASMARLEEIVTLLERGDAPLDQAMSLFEEGAKLAGSCGELLDRAEQKVNLLLNAQTGEEIAFDKGE